VSSAPRRLDRVGQSFADLPADLVLEFRQFRQRLTPLTEMGTDHGSPLMRAVRWSVLHGSKRRPSIACETELQIDDAFHQR
jgi:hypothetical protein